MSAQPNITLILAKLMQSSNPQVKDEIEETKSTNLSQLPEIS